MKLKNKKTGEIGTPRVDYQELYVDTENGCTYDYKSLQKMYDEWEDYEEPKEYWYIEPNGVIARIDEWDCCTDSDIEIMKALGNYFDTREEAEKAVEKLKAAKRLKDKGISFGFKVIDRKWYLAPKAEPQQRTFDDAHDIFEDIKIVFGDEK